MIPHEENQRKAPASADEARPKRAPIARKAAAVLAAVFAIGTVSMVAVPAGRWRFVVVRMKLAGEFPDFRWGELLWNLRPGSTTYLGNLPATGNPYLAIQNAFTSNEDIQTGSEEFRALCTGCHGSGARGTANGPDLTAAAFAERSSDWLVYRAITRGIRGSSMRGRRLPARTVWRIVAYVRSLGQPTPQPAAGPSMRTVSVPFETLLHADGDPAGWYTYSGTYQSHRFSSLREIGTRNAARLQLLWLYQLPTADRRVETSPIVVDEVMFVTEPPSSVVALDARTGGLIWRYDRRLPEDLALCCGRVNRGLAVLDSRLYLGTLDAHLVALDARTGRVMWDTQVADPRDGYSITAAPLAVKDMVVTGVAGGEYGVRGFIDAYDARSGRRRWRFYTVPGPGEPGSETWSGVSSRTGGAPTWLTGSYDPQLNMVYWGVGNPSPVFSGEGRLGDNLYSNSVVALDADSGRLRWHFQFTPHDDRDWDAVQIPVLLDASIRGTPRRLMAWANRNAFYYLLDRQTGRFLLARPFSRQTWAERIDSTGRPVELPGARPTPSGQLVYPAVVGATNWWSPSYSPQTGLLYVPVLEEGAIIFRGRARYERGELFWGSSAQRPANQIPKKAVRALDPLTGVVRWEHQFAPQKERIGMGGVLSSAGDVVFVGDANLFLALNARTGRELWRFNVGGFIISAPVTYLVNGRQQVAVAAGRSILAFGLPPDAGQAHSGRSSVASRRSARGGALPQR